jgi:DNA polymerase sigma
MVPVGLGFFPESLPIDFSINAVTPFYTAALLTECGQFEPRAKALILLVKRWAKDRGICFAAKGHLSPYLWSLLVIYFLQVGLKDASTPLLPLLDAFKISRINQRSGPKREMTEASSSPFSASDVRMSVADLFEEFVKFYEQRFDWQNEAISIRSGKRAPPDVSLPLHIILRGDGTRHGVGPSIEDPFKKDNNLGVCMNEVSLPRLHEEFSRALEFCTRGASLSELLTPWAPESTDQNNGIGWGAAELEENDGGAC